MTRFKIAIKQHKVKEKCLFVLAVLFLKFFVTNPTMTFADVKTANVTYVGSAFATNTNILGHNIGMSTFMNTNNFFEDRNSSIFNQELLSLSRGIPLRNVRLHLSNHYDWKKTIGPVEQREKLFCNNVGAGGVSNGYTGDDLECRMPYYGQTETNETIFTGGLDEMIQWVNEVNPQTNIQIIASPYMDSDQDIADLIEYLNGSTSTVWGKKRSDNGHPEAYNIKTIILGNENYNAASLNWYTPVENQLFTDDPEDGLKLRGMTINEYIDSIKRISSIIRNVDPTIKIIANGNPNGINTSGDSDLPNDWNRRIVDEVATGDLSVDAIDLHLYYDSNDKLLMTKVKNFFEGYTDGQGYHAGGLIDSLISYIDTKGITALDGSPFGISINEHSRPLYNTSQDQHETRNLQGAISTSDFLMEAFKRPEILNANNWALTEARFLSMIDLSGSGSNIEYFKTPIYDLYKLFNKALGSKIQRINVSSDPLYGEPVDGGRCPNDPLDPSDSANFYENIVQTNTVKSCTKGGESVTNDYYPYSANALLFKNTDNTTHSIVAVNRSTRNSYNLVFPSNLVLPANTRMKKITISAPHLSDYNTVTVQNTTYLEEFFANQTNNFEISPKSIVAYIFDEVPTAVMTPFSGSTDVSLDFSPTLTFSEAIDPVTVNNTTIGLKRYADGAIVPSQITYNASSRVATINPDNNLDYNTQYYIFISALSVKDMAGNNVATWDSSNKINHEFKTSSAPPPINQNVYRFWNANGTHFYTASEAEKNNVIAKWPRTYKYEGVAYSVNLNSQKALTPLYRLWNTNGTHFYTASYAEAVSAVQKWPTRFKLEGVAYNVTQDPTGTPVYRFYNSNGTHFYTASVAEKNNIIARWPGQYKLEGVAYYLPQ